MSHGENMRYIMQIHLHTMKIQTTESLLKPCYNGMARLRVSSERDCPHI